MKKWKIVSFFLPFILLSISSFATEIVEIPILEKLEEREEQKENKIVDSETSKEVTEESIQEESIEIQSLPKLKTHYVPWKKEESEKMIDLVKEERYEDLRNRTNKISSLGSAMGAIDLGSTPANKIRFGAGVGNTPNSQAVAVGVGYAPTENFKINTKFSTTTDSTSNRGVSFGASYDLDW